MQLSEFRTDVLDMLGLQAGDPFWPDAKLNRFINRALRHISTRHDWPWLEVETTFNTAVGTKDYSPPAGWRKTEQIAIRGDDLDYRTKRDAKEYEGYDNSLPVVYTFVADQIRLLPVPSTIVEVTHVYTRHEPELTLDTSEPILPEEYADYLTVTAARRAAAAMGDSERMLTMAALIDDWERRLDDDVLRSKAYPKVKARRDWRLNV